VPPAIVALAVARRLEIGRRRLTCLNGPSPRIATVDMTSRAPSPSMNPEFDNFLFAPVREEKNGMVLSVISGLTRLEIDPWTEAARLSALPKAIAAQTLAPIIARLADGGAELFDARKVADRLISLLPTGTSPVSVERADRGDGRSRRLWLAIWLICIVLAGTVGFRGATTRQEAPADSNPVAAPAATTASPLTSK
jgi:hypothetical protein